MKSLETNKDYLKINSVIKDPAQSYEAYINQRALINSFNRETIMTLDGQSYTDMVLNMVEEFSELKNKYPILTQFTIPKVKTGERVLSLNDVKSLKDSQLAEIYFQNLQDLGNEDIKKVIDPEDNKRISKLFALLPQMMMYQHGIGYSKYGFNKALPYEGFIGVMQTASEIFINKQLNEDTLAVIFDKLVEPGNKVFKNLLVTPKQYLVPEPSVVEEDEFMSVEEAEAMFERMGIKPIEEEPTQPSTSVKATTRKTYSGKVTTLTPNQIFVFGSNPEGRHGAGAAKYAKDNFGAMYGQGEGLQGQSYALPTKDLRVKENNSLRSISPEQIISSIKKLYDLANRGYKEFLVSDYSGTNLNGYTGQEMADMFIAAGPIPDNIVFHENFDKLISNQPSSDTPITGKITDTNAPDGLPGIPRTSTDCQ